MISRLTPVVWVLLMGLTPSLYGCSPGLEERIERARALADEGAFAEALPELTTLHYEAPRDPEVNHLYGLTLLRTRNGGMAVWPLRVAAHTPGREVEDGLLLAHALAAGSIPEDAIDAVDRVLEFEPESIEAWTLRSRVNQGMKKFEWMLGDCSEVLAIDDTRVDAILCRVEALSSLDRFEEAEEFLAEGRERIAARAAIPPRLDWRLCMMSAGLAYTAAQTAIETASRGTEESTGHGAGKSAGQSTEESPSESAENYAEAVNRWEGCIAKSPTALEIMEPAILFFDAIGDEERGTRIIEHAAAAEPHRFELVGALAGRLASLGRDEESERVLMQATERTGTARQAWLALANYYRQRDDFDQAIAAMDTALAENASLPPLHIAQYADDLIQAGEFERADDVIAQLPDHPMVPLLRGRAHLKRGDAEAALEELDKGMELWPDNATARYLAGQAAESLGEIDRALEEYRNAIRSDPARTPAALDLARILEAEGNFTAALIALRHRVDAVPDEADAHIVVLRIARRTGRLNHAREVLETLSEIPGQEVTVAIESAALAVLENGPGAAAKSIVESDLDLMDPDHAEGLGALAHYLVLDGEEEEALARVDEALAMHPEDAGLHEVHGVALLAASGNQGDARAAFERALDLEPERATALARLAQLALQDGDEAAAIEFFDRASASDPEESAYAWRAIEILESSRETKVMLDASMDAEIDRRVQALLAQDSIHPGAALLRAERLIAEHTERVKNAVSLEEAGSEGLDEALDFAIRAVRFGGGASAVIVRARVATLNGQTGVALEVLRRLEEREPRSPSVWYELALAYEEAGATEQARSALERALQSEDFNEASEARQLLARWGVDTDA